MTKPFAKQLGFMENERVYHNLINRFLKASSKAVGLIFAIVMIMAVVLSGFGVRIAIAQPESVSLEYFRLPQKNLFVFTTVEDFQQGETDGTVVIDSGNGAVILKDSVSSGTYTSPVVETEPFEYMVLSWNAETPDSTYIEIQGRVHVLGEWSHWISWGKWSSTAFTEKNRLNLPGSSGHANEDGLAKIAIDELIVKGQAGETGDAFQYRLTLFAPENGNAGVTPKVRLVACTLRNTLPGQAIPKLYPEDAPDLSSFEMDLDVPTYSQYTRDPAISGSICSPTCVAMVLGYYGVDISPEESAWNARDYEEGIFGNWSFNVASAASYGFTSYVDYVVPEEGADPWYPVKHQIAANRPVIVSVRYRKPGFPSPLPPVEGVPIDHTGGHLVLIRGFTWKDGIEYVIVNDPAASHNDEVRREYPADQFFDAWVKKVAYVLYEDEKEIKEAEAAFRPMPFAAQLIPVGKQKDGYQKFRLQADDEAIEISTLNIRSIVVSYNGEKTEPVALRSFGEDSDLLWLEVESEPGTYTFTFMGRNKDYYRAEIVWPLPKSNTLIFTAVGLVIAAVACIAMIMSKQKARKSGTAVTK